MMVLFNISGYEYQIRSQAPEKALFLPSRRSYLRLDDQKRCEGGVKLHFNC